MQDAQLFEQLAGKIYGFGEKELVFLKTELMYSINSTNVTIMVTNMNLAIDFYTSIGLTLKNRWGDYYAMVEAPGITIGLHPAATTEHSKAVSIGFGVEDLEPVKAKLEELNISFRVQEDGKAGDLLHFADPNGFPLYFIKQMS